MLPRSFLFVPGDSEKKLQKSLGLEADALILCLEDSVSEANKACAREITAAHLRSVSRDTRAALWVRVNAYGSGHMLKDLAAIVPTGPAGIFLPKPESGEDFVRLHHYLSMLEVEHDLELGSTRILSVAESAVGTLNQSQFARATDRLVGLTWGAEDMSADLGASTNVDEQGAHFLVHQMNRAQCLVVAAAGNMQAIDGICADYRDHDRLRQECLRSRQEGFSGKIAIHPSQLSIINECFTPSKEEIDYARRVIEAFAQTDSGTVGLDGKMLDLPHLKQAQRLMNFAH